MAPTHAFIPTIPGSSTNKVNQIQKTNVSSIASSSTTFKTSTNKSISSAPRLSTLSPPATVTSTPSGDPKALGNKPSRILFLFCDDLRVDDNLGLVNALNDSKQSVNGTLIPAVISMNKNNNSKYIQSLSNDVSRLGSTLVQLSGMDMIMKLCKQLNLQAVYMNYAMTKQGSKLQKQIESQLKNVQVQLSLYWGNSLINPEASHLQCCSKNKYGSCCKNKKSRTSVIDIRQDILKQSVQNVIALKETPKSLPALPVEAKSFSTMTTNSHKSYDVVGTSQALKLLSHCFDKHSEFLTISKQKDVAIVVKPFLDSGVLSLSMVANHIAKQLNGQLKGRTFSELVWRNYISFASNASVGTVSARSSKVSA